MPLPLVPIIWVAVAAFGAAVVTLAIVYWDNIIKWFEERNDLVMEDKDNIAFTLQDKIAKGEYKTVQGVFNKKSNTIKDARVMESKDVDEKLKNAHKKDKLVIYQ